MTTAAVGQMQCCECGTLMEPNPTSLCLPCLRNRVDITEGLQRQCVLAMCPKCSRYLQPPNQWVTAEPESKELLALCLKRIRGLNKVRLVDAGFIWTEPHSRRHRLKVTVQAEVLNGAIAEQACEVEFVLQSHQCDQCNRSAAKDFWRALVQLRQHSTSHPKTLLYLEQLILKHQAHKECTGVKRSSHGLDFFFAQRQDARRLADFLAAHSPSRCHTSETLVSHDTHSNVFNYKYTYCVEVAPVCKDDVVCLPPPVARKLSSVGQFCVVYRVTDRLHLVDPVTCRTAEVSGKQFWQAPFQALQAKLSNFTVTNCEPLEGQQSHPGRFLTADVWLLTDSDLSADEVHCRTHLGRLLACGDTARGLDLRRANVNHAEFERLAEDKVPDVVLVKKVYGGRDAVAASRHRRRWRLRRLEGDAGTDTAAEAEGEEDPAAAAAYQDFLDDLEEDKELRRGVNIYKDPSATAAAAAAGAAAAAAEDEEGAPRIGLDEMLEDLNLGEDVDMQ